MTVRTQPNLLPTCDQPALSMSGTTKLWGNVNVLARCNNEKRFLQVNVQATGNYVVAAQPIARGSVLQTTSVELKRGRLDQLPPRTMLDINQAQDSVSLARFGARTGDTTVDAASGMARESRATRHGDRQRRRV